MSFFRAPFNTEKHIQGFVCSFIPETDSATLTVSCLSEDCQSWRDSVRVYYPQDLESRRLVESALKNGRFIEVLLTKSGIFSQLFYIKRVDYSDGGIVSAYYSVDMKRAKTEKSARQL